MATNWPIVFMGTPEIAAVTLKELLQGPDPVVGAVTQPDRPAGRGQKTISSPVRGVAESHGVPVIAPEKIRDPGFLATLNDWNPQIIVVVAFGRILPATILDLAPHGCVNVHYSLLPKYRGAAPAAWTIINGEEKGGVTTMRLEQKMDAGPIYLQEETAVPPDETTASLQDKLTPVGARLLLETIRRLKDGTLAPQTQDEAKATFAPMIKKEDGLIDWSRSAAEIERRVRGFTPWPSAYTARQIDESSSGKGHRYDGARKPWRNHPRGWKWILGSNRLRRAQPRRSPVGKQEATPWSGISQRGKDWKR